MTQQARRLSQGRRRADAGRLRIARGGNGRPARGAPEDHQTCRAGNAEFLKRPARRWYLPVAAANGEHRDQNDRQTPSATAAGQMPVRRAARPKSRIAPARRRTDENPACSPGRLFVDQRRGDEGQDQQRHRRPGQKIHQRRALPRHRKFCRQSTASNVSRARQTDPGPDRTAPSARPSAPMSQKP